MQVCVEEEGFRHAPSNTFTRQTRVHGAVDGADGSLTLMMDQDRKGAHGSA